MYKSCPISNKVINSRIIRMVAFQVLIFASLFLVTHNILFVYILLFDFAMRALRMQRLSSLLYFANAASRVIGIKPKMCDEAPKRFALHLGLSTVSLAALSHIASYTMVSQSLMVMMVIFSSLEALFDFCVGCKIYQYLSVLKKK